MRCAQFLEIGQNNRLTRGVDALMETLTRRYKSTLTWSLNHRWTVVIVAAVLFHGSLLLFPLVKMELMPPQDQNILFLRMETPVGSSMGFTDETLKKVEAFTMDRGEVERYYAAVGGLREAKSTTPSCSSRSKPRKNDPRPRAGAARSANRN